MPERATIIISIIFWFLLLSFLYLTKNKKDRLKLRQSFFSFSGLKYILKKLFSTGWIWVFGIYFVSYAFVAQRYESQLDKIEVRYNTFTSQVEAGATFSHERLMKILNRATPMKPYILNPLSIIQSFYGSHFSKQFFQSYGHKTAAGFRQEIINQWKNKLKGANFVEAELEGTNFMEAELEGANFLFANLKGANFKGAGLEGVDFLMAKLQGADFINAELKGAAFVFAELKEALFIGAELKEVNFINAKLKKVDFRAADLEGTDFFAVQYLTAKQLIMARNIYGIKNCPSHVRNDIKKYKCERMLTETPDKWPKEFKDYRAKLISQWQYGK